MASILVVDDSVSIRAMLKTLLNDVGHQVSDAANGEDALELAKHNNFDLVMTDVNMPVLDGIDLCRTLRGMQRYRFTPVLIITTEDSNEIKQRGKSAGAAGWLVKPFDPEKLLNTVSLLCGRGK